MEGEGGSLVPDPLVGEAGGGHDLDDVESGPGHVVEVEGGEVGELVDGVGFGVGVGGLDLSADLVEGLGNEGGLADELEAETFDEVLQIALKESLHNGRRSAARHFLWRENPPTGRGSAIQEISICDSTSCVCPNTKNFRNSRMCEVGIRGWCSFVP